jgi:hypothetical protein
VVAKLRAPEVVFVGQKGSNNTTCANYITSQFTGDEHIWKVLNWHENQNRMQIGYEPDDMGWDVYEKIRMAGTLIMTGYEHSYHRTVTLLSIMNQTRIRHSIRWSTASQVAPTRCVCGRARCPRLSPAWLSAASVIRSVVRRPRNPCDGGSGCNYIWAKFYTSDQGARCAALFIIFHVDGDPRKAWAYFKMVNGQIIDRFELRASPP